MVLISLPVGFYARSGLGACWDRLPVGITSPLPYPFVCLSYHFELVKLAAPLTASTRTC